MIFALNYRFWNQFLLSVSHLSLLPKTSLILIPFRIHLADSKILKRDFEWSPFALIEPMLPFLLPYNLFFVVWHKFCEVSHRMRVQLDACGKSILRITLCIISNLSSTRKPFNTCLSGSPERVFSPFTLLYLGVFVRSVTQIA